MNNYTVPEEIFAITDEEKEIYKKNKEKLVPLLDEYVNIIFQKISETEFLDLVSDRTDEIAEKLRAFLERMFEEPCNPEFFETCVELWIKHLHLEIPFELVFITISHIFKHLIEYLVKIQKELYEFEKFAHLMVKLKDLIFLSLLKAYDHITKEHEEIISEISTPVMLIWDEILSVPLIGYIDSNRFMNILETILNAVQKYNAKVVLIDISGVSYIDSDIASKFVKMIQAISLMGAITIFVGIKPKIAKSFVNLGMDFSSLGLKTFATFKQGLTEAFKLLNISV